VRSARFCGIAGCSRDPPDRHAPVAVRRRTSAVPRGCCAGAAPADCASECSVHGLRPPRPCRAAAPEQAGRPGRAGARRRCSGGIRCPSWRRRPPLPAASLAFCHLQAVPARVLRQAVRARPAGPGPPGVGGHWLLGRSERRRAGPARSRGSAVRRTGAACVAGVSHSRTGGKVVRPNSSGNHGRKDWSDRQ
jgi:hypothetical protein